MVDYISSDHQLVLCDYVIEEFRVVAAQKFAHKAGSIEDFLLDLPYEFVYTPRLIERGKYPSVRDEKDSPILATAVLENVDVFITGDQDFLVLEELEAPKIVSIAGFLERYI